MAQKPKVLLVSQTLAPAVGGSPILLNNLFSHFDGEVLGISGYVGSSMDPAFKPAFKTVYFNPPSLPIIGKLLRRYHDFMIRYLHSWITSGIVRRIKEFKPDVVFAACPNIDYFICAHRAARKCGIPFYAHMHDLWEENHDLSTYTGKMAVQWEKKILMNSDRVLCMTDVQAKHYARKYAIQCPIIPHSIPDGELSPEKLKFNPVYDKTVVFTGAVSRVMNEDALRVFSDASEEITGLAKILLCTSATHQTFQRRGVDSSRWDIQWVSRDEVQDIQSQAGVLFAPLSMKNAGMDEIKTVFSTKLLEYLVSGRPILIFAPKESFHSQSATSGGWAYVVNEDDPRALASAIQKLLDDEALQMDIVHKAFEEARSRRSSKVAEHLLKLVDADLANLNGKGRGR